jgi:class 3 adenylate cyclase
MLSLSTLGNRIRQRREKRGLKQQDVANALDISPQAVSKWERGENAPDVATLGPLARLLGTTVDWLLDAGDPARDTFEAAVLVSSIRGAHRKSLGMKPREFALWANGLFHQLTEICLAHRGVPVKYMGDGFLCFFSGAQCGCDAIESAVEAKRILSEDLKMGLSWGEIFLGLVGHHEYARPDVMGEVVNIAFLTQGWADTNAEGGIAVTGPLLAKIPEDWIGRGSVEFGDERPVRFKGVRERVPLHEVRIVG